MGHNNGRTMLDKSHFVSFLKDLTLKNTKYRKLPYTYKSYKLIHKLKETTNEMKQIGFVELEGVIMMNITSTDTQINRQFNKNNDNDNDNDNDGDDDDDDEDGGDGDDGGGGSGMMAVVVVVVVVRSWVDGWKSIDLVEVENFAAAAALTNACDIWRRRRLLSSFH
ncbi:hypothetical protein DINM_006734 [Dirofilaria immitis]|nr:hypothetical protein [Dirofilaria immitis]